MITSIYNENIKLDTAPGISLFVYRGCEFPLPVVVDFAKQMNATGKQMIFHMRRHLSDTYFENVCTGTDFFRIPEKANEACYKTVVYEMGEFCAREKNNVFIWRDMQFTGEIDFEYLDKMMKDSESRLIIITSIRNVYNNAKPLASYDKAFLHKPHNFINIVETNPGRPYLKDGEVMFNMNTTFKEFDYTTGNMCTVAIPKDVAYDSYLYKDYVYHKTAYNVFNKFMGIKEGLGIRESSFITLITPKFLTDAMIKLAIKLGNSMPDNRNWEVDNIALYTNRDIEYPYAENLKVDSLKEVYDDIKSWAGEKWNHYFKTLADKNKVTYIPNVVIIDYDRLSNGHPEERKIMTEMSDICNQKNIIVFLITSNTDIMQAYPHPITTVKATLNNTIRCISSNIVLITCIGEGDYIFGMIKPLKDPTKIFLHLEDDGSFVFKDKYDK